MINISASQQTWIELSWLVNIVPLHHKKAPVTSSLLKRKKISKHESEQMSALHNITQKKPCLITHSARLNYANELAHQRWHITIAPQNTSLNRLFWQSFSTKQRKRACSYDGREMSIIHTDTHLLCVLTGTTHTHTHTVKSKCTMMMM